MNIATTHLVEYVPYPHRNERCAVALLVHRPGQGYRMYLCDLLKKARAINPACDLSALRDGLHAIAAQLDQTPQSLSLYAAGATGIVISPREGRITYQTEDEFASGVQWALSVAVNPIKAIRPRERASVSRLFIEIKNTFNSFGWVAPYGQPLSEGKIVPRCVLSQDEGLAVDFAQQGKGFLAIQTLDYRHNASAKRLEANAKLLTLGLSAQIIASPSNRRLAVFAGSDAPEAATALRLAERVSDDIFLEESSEDMRRLVDVIASSVDAAPLSESA